MTAQPTVSIIVPAYNAAEHLEACLTALASSRELGCEIIVVDDGSTDESASIARHAGARVVTTPAARSGAAILSRTGYARPVFGSVPMNRGKVGTPKSKRSVRTAAFTPLLISEIPEWRSICPTVEPDARVTRRRLSKQIFELHAGVGLAVAIFHDHRRIERNVPLFAFAVRDGA